MSRIGIPFNEWSLERIFDGRKICTSRNKKYGKVGDIFVMRGQIFKLTLVAKTKLIIVAKFHYKEEGAASPEEFIEVWKSIHPRAGWTPDKYVWLHMFEQIGEV